MYLGFNLGGVGLDANGTIDFVSSVRFVYYLKSEEAVFDKLSESWENEVQRWMTDEWPNTEEHKVNTFRGCYILLSVAVALLFGYVVPEPKIDQ